MLRNLLSKIARYILRSELDRTEYEMAHLYNQLLDRNTQIDKYNNTIDNLRTEIGNRLFTAPPQTKVVYRIPREVFNKIKSKLQPCVVIGSTTDIQVAALVGQQRALDIIEQEIVIE